MMLIKLSRKIINKLPFEHKRRIAELLPERFLEWYSEKSTDVFLISFPKCGRTWLRLMIGKAIQFHFNLPDINILELHQFEKSNPSIPRILATHDDYPDWKRPDELTELKANYKHAKVIFLVRDPRDVVVSMYFHKKKREDSYDGRLSEFLREQVGSLDTIIRYYNIWAENRNIPKDFLLVRYEDIHKNPQKELRRVLDFLGLQTINDEVINEAVKHASFENMHKMEKEDTFNSFRLRPTNKKDEESYKTRKGKVGGYVDYLNKEEIKYLNQSIGDTLRLYGY